MKKPSKKERGKLEQALSKAKVPTAKRHLFLCLGPDCCEPREGEKTWDYIKQRTKELDLDVMRTKAPLLPTCASPARGWSIYPDGIWYSKVTPKRFERILQEHLLGGKPVDEWIAVRNPLDAYPPLPLKRERIEVRDSGSVYLPRLLTLTLSSDEEERGSQRLVGPRSCYFSVISRIVFVPRISRISSRLTAVSRLCVSDPITFSTIGSILSRIPSSAAMFAYWTMIRIL